VPLHEPYQHATSSRVAAFYALRKLEPSRTISGTSSCWYQTLVEEECKTIVAMGRSGFFHPKKAKPVCRMRQLFLYGKKVASCVRFVGNSSHLVSSMHTDWLYICGFAWHSAFTIGFVNIVLVFHAAFQL
jgi:hypothetical protein